MRPLDLHPESFSRYPPQGRDFAIKHLPLLRRLPLMLLPILLREIKDYDWCFPAERHTFERQFDYLETLPTASFALLVATFNALSIPSEVEQIDWVNQPHHFSERLSALLWSTQQIDEYHKAAGQYQAQLAAALVESPPSMSRFTIVIVGQGVSQTKVPLFRMLRPQGALFTAVRPDRGWETLLDFVIGRAGKHPEPYAHWYIDGGLAEPSCGVQQGITVTSYHELARFALKELSLMESFVEQTGAAATTAPEAAQSFMAALSSEDLGLDKSTGDVVMRHFNTRLLTEGAGTQVFSTTFVQWAAREALRRAQPVTTLVRFTPRQQMAPMNELLKRNPLTQLTDPEGSLVDADMGAYYTWINQSRLSGADQARFLVWFEGHEVALAIAPTLPRGTTSDSPTDMTTILQWMS